METKPRDEVRERLNRSTPNSSWEALSIIEHRYGGVLKSTNSGGVVREFGLLNDDLDTTSLLKRVMSFKNDERGLGFVPRGDEVALRESLVREAVVNSDVVIPNESGEQVVNHNGVRAKVIINAGAYGKYVSEIHFDRRGFDMISVGGVVRRPEYEVEEGVRKTELDILVAALKINDDFHKQAVGEGILANDLYYLNPEVWIDKNPNSKNNKSRVTHLRMENTGVDSLNKLKDKHIL